MDALILSCSTGGGHNAAGFAVREELLARGHHVEMMDPYALVSQRLAEEVGNVYVKMVQRAPKMFGVVYSLGNLVRYVPGKSPVYYANIAVAKKLRDYLSDHHFDVILMPHLYPAELVTYLKKQGVKLPLTVFIATDYVCIPFTEETDCDYYITPGERQMHDFVRRKIPREKLLPFGIPVGRAFDEEVDKEEAKRKLGLDEDKQYYLLTGGSIGAGAIQRSLRILVRQIRRKKQNAQIIVVCGNNDRLFRKLKFIYRNQLILLKRTRQMALYMKACDIFISKPGGLSSTEAAVTGVPYIQITPIPGCESHNMKYFSRNGMSIGVRRIRFTLANAVAKLQREDVAEHMRKCQCEGVPQDGRKRICDWLELQAGKKEEL